MDAFMNGEKIVLENMLNQIFDLRNSRTVGGDFNLNSDFIGFVVSESTAPQNAPTGNGTWSLFLSIQINSYDRAQFMIDNLSQSLYLRTHNGQEPDSTGNWSAWKQIGG